MGEFQPKKGFIPDAKSQGRKGGRGKEEGEVGMFKLLFMIIDAQAFYPFRTLYLR